MTGIDFTSTNNIFYGDRRVVGAYMYESLDEPPFAKRHTVFEYEKPIFNLALNQPSFGQYISRVFGDGPKSITDGDFDTYLSQGEGYFTTRFGVQFANELNQSIPKQWNRVRFYTSSTVTDDKFNKTYLRMRTQIFPGYQMGKNEYNTSGGFNHNWTLVSSSPTIIPKVVAPNGRTYTVFEYTLSVPRQSYGILIENGQGRIASNILINQIEVFYDE